MSWRLWTMDSLFVCSTPPLFLLWLHHAVIFLVGRWSSELRASLPMNVSYCIAICFLMLVISKGFLFTVSFVMCWSPTSSVLMPNIRRMLRCENNSSFFSRDVRSAQLSHPHGSILMGMATKIKYLLLLWIIASVQILARAPVASFLLARGASVS